MFLIYLAIYIIIGCGIMLMIAKHYPDLPAVFEKVDNPAWMLGCCVGLILSIVALPVIIVKGVMEAFND